jgi:PAB-dependent poly(A)-specific ribonuclease subunit 2
MTHKATCQTCKHFSNFSSRRAIASEDLPPFLALNASVYNDENQEYWLDSKSQTFLPARVQLHGQLGDDLDSVGIWYEVKVRMPFSNLSKSCNGFAQSLVVKITTKERQSHLVSLVKSLNLCIRSFDLSLTQCISTVPDAELDGEYESPWFVFNDFMVQNISERDALGFPGKWKVGCCA